MAKTKQGYKEMAARNNKIVELQGQKMKYKEIARELGVTVGVINAAMRKHRETNPMPANKNPYKYVLDQSRIWGLRGGKISEVCHILGIDAVKWLWKSKPSDLNFAEYIGVIVKDAYLEEVDG